MIDNLLSFIVGGVVGIAAGAMLLDAYHDRQHAALLAMADDERNERNAVRQELARSEMLVESLSTEIARLRAQRSQAEALHAERIRRTLEAAKWN